MDLELLMKVEKIEHLLEDILKVLQDIRRQTSAKTVQTVGDNYESEGHHN